MTNGCAWVRVALIVCLGSAGLAAADIDSNGFILTWLILGPYSQPYGDDAGIDNIRRDYLTDGVITEETVVPGDGREIDTDYSIAASQGLLPEANAAVNPTGIPQWYKYTSTQDTIDHNLIFLTDVNNHVTYAATWLVNLTGEDIPNVRAGTGSDDSLQVILGADQEIVIVNAARGWGSAGEIQDWSGRFTIPAGRTRLMVKVFDGGGSSGFRIKFEDGQGALLSDRLAIRTDPYGSCPLDVGVEADSWLREVTFRWAEAYPSVQVFEGGVAIASAGDETQEIRLSNVSPGTHRYEVVADLLEFGPRCAAVPAVVDIVPAWPEDFACVASGTSVRFSWRNLEGYYEVVKIQEGGFDVPGIVFESNESAVLPAATVGPHQYALVCEGGGFRGESFCDVTIAGEPIFLRGDVNASGTLDIADAIAGLDYIFGSRPVLCIDAVDMNNDAQIDIGDPIWLLTFLFASGP
ncbi:MAG: hypothetical protein JXP34_13760, partial [Planctomycetes bacterium]|nr:hypothetical protein [Planctomycetota bacterium]